jgi:hypothetical protein
MNVTKEFLKKYVINITSQDYRSMTNVQKYLYANLKDGLAPHTCRNTRLSSNVSAE